MSSAALDKVIDNLVKRLKSNIQFRDYLNRKPHVVTLDPSYLIKHFGATEAQLDTIWDEVRKYISNLHSRAPKDSRGYRIKRYARFYEDRGLIVFTYPGTSSNFNRAKKIVNIVQKALNRKDLDTGHLFTANVTEGVRHKITTASVDKSEKDLLMSKYHEAVGDYRKLVQEEMQKEGLKIDTYFAKEIVHGKEGKGVFAVGVTPQIESLNRDVIGGFEKVFKQEILEKLDALKGSDSFNDMIKIALTKAFLEGKAKTQKSRTKARRRNLEVIGGNGNIPAIAISNSFKGKEKRGFGRGSMEIQLIGLLNAQINRFVQLNMGKGAAKNKLNYRTGRFADSVKIVDVAHTLKGSGKDELLIDYAYQENPYNVFAPGGRLYTTGRDPSRLINASIRQLARAIVTDRFRISPRHVGDSGWSAPRR